MYLRKISVFKFVMIFLLAWTFFPASFVSASGFTAAPTKVGQEVLLDSGLNSKSVVLVDAGSETVMYQKNATTVSIPASLVKVLAVDVLLARNTDLETLITIQKQDLTTSGVLVVKAGETYRAMDLVYASLIASDNTAIKALARSSGLTTAQFATEMTKRAQQMGAVNTVALEPVGLNVKNKTTAMDLVKILSYMNHSDFYRSVTSLKQYKFETKKGKKLTRIAKSTNPLLTEQAYFVVAGKTGTLPNVGSNLAVVLNDGNGRELYAVFLGARNKQLLVEDVRRVVFWGWNNYVWSY